MSKYVETLLGNQQALPTKNTKKLALIEEINNESTLTTDHGELNHENSSSTDRAIPTVAFNSSAEEQNEGPSMLELMIAAQKEAYDAKKNDQSKESPPFAGGFRKGFFKTKTSTTKMSKNAEIVNVPIKHTVDKNSKSSVLENVKHALKEEQMKSQEENDKKYGPLSQFLNKNGSSLSLFISSRIKISLLFPMIRMGHSRLARCFTSQ